MTVILKDKFEKMLSSAQKQAVLSSAEHAENFGVHIYLIGGIVRDFIMGNEIKDIDIAVEGNAIEFAKYLTSKIECRIEAVQENLKTAKVVFPSGVEIDFASTREELYTKSGVLPEAYNFGCRLQNDVKRRDFTINTLALKLTGEDKFKLIDFYDGYSDIQNKLIKVLHNNSFIDDPSRIVRALKFKERFNFEYSEETYTLMQRYLQNPDKSMPLERVKSELKQYFSIKQDNLYKEIIRTNTYKLISDNPIINIKEENFEQINQFHLYKEEDIPFIYIIFLIVNSDYDISRLNLTSFEKKILFQVREMNSYKKTDTDEEIYRKYSDKEDLSLAIYYIISSDKNLIKFLTKLRQIKILLTGQDLIEMGLTPSKYFSQIFDRILSEKIKGNIHTKQDELNLVKNVIKKEGF